VTDETKETIETKDIQGLLLRGFGDLPSARFLLLEVINDGRARKYLQGLCTRLNLASDETADCALQVTSVGLDLVKIRELVDHQC